MALQNYRDSLLILKTLVKSDPGNSDWQRDLSISYGRVGGMHQAQRSNDKAILAYQDSIEIANILAISDPQFSWQRDISITYNKIGRAHEINGDSEKAMLAYQRSLTITTTLVKHDSNITTWQSDLSVI